VSGADAVAAAPLIRSRNVRKVYRSGAQEVVAVSHHQGRKGRQGRTGWFGLKFNASQAGSPQAVSHPLHGHADLRA
jgi:hypothetical protein